MTPTCNVIRGGNTMSSAGEFATNAKNMEDLSSPFRETLMQRIGATEKLHHLIYSPAFDTAKFRGEFRRRNAGHHHSARWTHYKSNVVERKNRLLSYLLRRDEPVVFDQVALTPPRVA